MKKFFLPALLIVALVASAQTNPSQPQPNPPQQSQPAAPKMLELNTELMNVTFMLTNQVAGPALMGTGFLIGRKYPSNPTKVRIVLVTATHVLDGMVGEKIFIIMRKRLGATWQSSPVEIQIRDHGKPLWVHHSKADVCAMYISLPTELLPAELLPTDLLVDDQTLINFEIHPGDELNVLGYPLGMSGTGGFPILRSGKISSYPIVPTSENPFFLLDFRVFKGNSGGPVYFVQSGRTFGGAMNIMTIQFIIGLVSEEIGYLEQSQGVYENSMKTTSLGLAKVIPATYISQTINLLPPVE